MCHTYIYAPFTGEIWGKTTYCDGSVHRLGNALEGSKPIDIAGNAGQAVYLYASSNVRSIRTRFGDVCATHTGWWDNGVNVDLYSGLNGQGYIATVAYGHLRDWNLYWTHNTIYGTNTKRLGSLPPDMCTDPDGTRQCACATQTCCSEGVHIHMQCTNSGQITTLPQCADRIVSAGGTWIYKWCPLS